MSVNHTEQYPQHDHQAFGMGGMFSTMNLSSTGPYQYFLQGTRTENARTTNRFLTQVSRVNSLTNMLHGAGRITNSEARKKQEKMLKRFDAYLQNGVGQPEHIHAMRDRLQSQMDLETANGDQPSKMMGAGCPMNYPISSQETMERAEKEVENIEAKLNGGADPSAYLLQSTKDDLKAPKSLKGGAKKVEETSKETIVLKRKRAEAGEDPELVGAGVKSAKKRIKKEAKTLNHKVATEIGRTVITHLMQTVDKAAKAKSMKKKYWSKEAATRDFMATFKKTIPEGDVATATALLAKVKAKFKGYAESQLFTDAELKQMILDHIHTATAAVKMVYADGVWQKVI